MLWRSRNFPATVNEPKADVLERDLPWFYVNVIFFVLFKSTCLVYTKIRTQYNADRMREFIMRLHKELVVKWQKATKIEQLFESVQAATELAVFHLSLVIMIKPTCVDRNLSSRTAAVRRLILSYWPTGSSLLVLTTERTPSLTVFR